MFGSAASRARRSLSPIGRSAGLERIAQVNAARASVVPVTAARAASTAATAVAERCGSGSPTRIGDAVVLVARMASTLGVAPAAVNCPTVDADSANTTGLVAITGFCAGTA